MPINKYEQLSQTRKRLQRENLAPDWYSTASYQLVTEKKYLNTAETPRDMFNRIADRAAELTTVKIPEVYGYDSWNEAFFDIMWKGWLSPSTPILTNMGNDRGHPISCAGTHIKDSIRGFGIAELEVAQLTQRGYGTSWCLDTIRPRGSDISTGGKSDGIMHPASSIVSKLKKVSQGTRRGSIGQYLDVLHPDFDELADQLISNDEDWNIGWNMTDEFHQLFTTDPERADEIWKKALKVKMIKGKGYFYFLDKVNRARPKMYKDRGLLVKHSNLCSEIALFDDEEHSFTCVLSSMNVSKFDEWENTYAVQIATFFLDAVISDMLEKAKKEEGFERIVRFTEKSRAIGLGQLGQSTYFQQKGWVFGDFDSIQFNQRLTKILDKESLIASKYLAKHVGEPEWMVGYGERFSHRLAFAPTKSTAIHMGGISEGIAPTFAQVFEQDSAAGTIYRINPAFLPLMKERGHYNNETMKRIYESQGSVQGEDWLTEREKKIFKTAFEINQETILLMASHRQKIMNEGGGGQGQSVNFYITKEETEKEISRLHHLAFSDPYLQSTYYVHSLNEDSVNKVDKGECEACQG